MSMDDDKQQVKANIWISLEETIYQKSAYIKLSR